MNSICDGLKRATLAYLRMFHLLGPHSNGLDAFSIKKALVAAHQLGLKVDADTTMQSLLDYQVLARKTSQSLVATTTQSYKDLGWAAKALLKQLEPLLPDMSDSDRQGLQQRAERGPDLTM